MKTYQDLRLMDAATCALLFFVLRGGDCGKPAYRPAEKENCCRLS